MQEKFESRFLEALSHDCGLEKGMRLLVGVSGGMDSMCLAHLLLFAQDQGLLEFGIAHVNYDLRSGESDGDAQLVENWAKEHRIPFFLLNEKLKKESGQSTQMAAREVRYSWFEKLRKENNYDRIATAHHLNDSFETALLNLCSGTGISGLRGVHFVNGLLLRPLLGFTRNEIEQFVNQNNIAFREDSSNTTDVYARNKIRNKVIPLLEELNPSLVSGFAKTSAILKDSEILLADAISLYRKKWFKKKGKDYQISILEIKKTAAAGSILFGTLKAFGFNAADVNDLLNSIQSGGSGKVFQSKTHRIIKDRKHLILTSLDVEKAGYFTIDEKTVKLKIPGLHFTVEFKNPKNYTTENMDNVALFEKSKIKFPLAIRKWESGDYFYPQGLLKKSGKAGKKKLKKYFSDQKMSLLDKERIWVLADAEQHILWLVGERQDHRFLPTENSKGILRIKIKERS